MSTIYKCDRCGKEMNKEHASLREIYIDSKNIQNHETLDLCEECYKDFKSFMFGPERDLDSDAFVKNPSKVAQCSGCEQCAFDSTSIDDEPCASCDSGNSNFKLISENEDCEQCKFKDFSWDEEPCSSCDVSILANNTLKRINFEPKKEEDSRYSTDADILSKAKYKIGSYIRSDIIKDQIYKIMDIRLRDDGEFIYTAKDLSTGLQNLLWDRVIDNWYTVIVKYSCDGCKLEGADDCMCDTCIVGDPKGPRRQWWKPKEEE